MKTRTITFSRYEDSISHYTARKVKGSWRRIISWEAGKLPVVARYPVAAPFMIEELERNQRELKA